MAKNKPVVSSRLGNVEVAVWENESEEGRTFYNSTIQVQYRTKDGGYKDGSSFSETDLACLTAAVHDALSEIQAMKR